MSRPTLATAWDSGRNNFHLIRLFAAWLVIWSHAWAITGTPGGDWLGQALGRTAGALAVDVFFLVSGFLVAASVQRLAWREFLVARALRLFPALAVCVALTVLVMGPLLTTVDDYWGDDRVWRYAWATASLWRAEFWLPGVFETLPNPSVNGSLWTLPIEARLYLLLLLASMLGVLKPWRYLPLWALALAGAAVFAVTRAPLPQHLAYLTWTVAFFITGTLMWLWRERVRLDGRWLPPMVAAVFLARDSLLFAPLYVATVVHGALWLAFVPRLPVIRRNDLSYGLYLYGWPMQQLAFLMGAASVLANTVVSSVLALACAALSWFLVERPALALKTRMLPPSRRGAVVDSAPEALEVQALKADSFGRIALMRDANGWFVRRDLAHVPLWLRLPAGWLASREARGLRAVAGVEAVPQLLRWDGRCLDRSFLGGAAMYQRPPRGDLAYFRLARRRLQALHRRGVAHNDLAKEANWLVLDDGTPAIIDFQLAVRGRPRSPWIRLLAREDLRHLLKHKRTYCPGAITPVERRLLRRRSWVRELWFATGKRVYRFVTRRILHWEDNEGLGPRP